MNDELPDHPMCRNTDAYRRALEFWRATGKAGEPEGKRPRVCDRASLGLWYELIKMDINDIQRGLPEDGSNPCCALWMGISIMRFDGRLHPVNHCPTCGRQLREQI